jgi:hypothetical protein
MEDYSQIKDLAHWEYTLSPYMRAQMYRIDDMDVRKRLATNLSQINGRVVTVKKIQAYVVHIKATDRLNGAAIDAAERSIQHHWDWINHKYRKLYQDLILLDLQV